MKYADALELLTDGYEPLPIRPREKRPALRRWQDIPLTPDRVTTLANTYPHHGVGVRLGRPFPGGYLLAVDVDVQDPEAAAAVLAILDERLGPSPTRYGRAPKALRLYVVPEVPRKRASPRYRDFLGVSHRLELLGEGQQCVVFGIHPDTGRPYHWQGGFPREVPRVSYEALDLVLEDFEALASRLGWDQEEPGTSALDFEPLAGYYPPVDVPPETLRRALFAQPADCGYDRWIRYGMALHHQFGGSDEGLALWDSWSATAGNYPGAEVLRSKWETFRALGPGRTVTARAILHNYRAQLQEPVEAPEDERLSPEEVRPLLHRGRPRRGEDEGPLLPTLLNTALVVARDRGVPPSRFNELLDQIEYGEGADALALEVSAVSLRHYISRVYGFEPATATCREAIELQASRMRYHPVRQYLLALKWDQVPRLDSWLTDYLGAPAEPWVRVVARKFLVAAAARAITPGVKWDYLLILEGEQRRGKSSAVHALSPVPTWSCDLDFSRDERRMQEVISRAWIVECGELRGMNSADHRALKSFVSRTSDTFRAAYDRYSRARPRQCIFIGTTNDSAYLHDETGGRRYIPVPVTGADLPGLSRARDQLWAEAVVAFREGEVLEWPPELLPLLADQQEARFLVDAWEHPIRAYLEDLAAPWITPTALALEALGISSDRLDRPAQQRIAAIARRLGWRGKTVRDPEAGRAIWAYCPAGGRP